MALTVVRFSSSPLQLRYHLVQPNAAADDQTVTMNGGPSPDLLTDIRPGPLLDRITQLAAGVYADGDAVFAAFFSDLQLDLRTPASTNIIPPGGGVVPGVVFDVDVNGKPLLRLGTANVLNTYLDLVLQHTEVL